MTDPATPVVVVTNVGPSDRLQRCLASIERFGGGPVVVVDNSGTSAGNDPAAFGDRCREVIATANDGYGAAANRGFDAARRLAPEAGAIALLNDDVVVSAGWLAPLWEAIDAGADVAQPKLLTGGPETVEVPTVNSLGVRLDEFGAGVDIGHGEPDTATGEIVPIEIFTGGAALLTVDFLERTGGFDERYFLYYEDVDLALRGGELGCRYACATGSQVWHEGGATTSSLGSRVRFLQERNRLWCAFRFCSKAMLVRALGLSLRRLRHAPRRVHARALLAGLAGGVRRLPERRRARRLRTEQRSASPRPPVRLPGVNLLGYHHAASGLGVAVRQLRASLEAAGVEVSTFDVAATASPRIADAAPTPGGPVRATTIAVVTAPELPAALAAHPELTAVARVVGYWFWELAGVPDTHRSAFGLVDEVWAPTSFIAEAYRSANGAPPVVVVPMHLAEPEVSPERVAAARRRLGAHDEFVFLTALDLFSIVERKNPFGVIDAFARLGPGSGTAPPRLVIKTLNGEQRPAALARIVDHVEASGAADRVTIIDEYLPDDEMAAMVAAADCLVSLHRGEGLGLHLAEAMWLGTPVVATRYSGNLDFMDDTNSLLIDAVLVPIANGEGAYPEHLEWAEPDSAQAAAAMQRLIDEPALGPTIATQAREAMQALPDSEQCGRVAAAALADTREERDPT